MMTIIIYISVMVMSQYLMNVCVDTEKGQAKLSTLSPLKMTVVVVVVHYSVDTGGMEGEN